MFDDEGPGYDTAQICLNGHVINAYFHGHPEGNRQFCERCGSKSVHECPACNHEIPGNPSNLIGDLDLPAFCGHCGMSYPWTRTAVAAAQALADEIAELTDDEKILLKGSIEDIVTASPRTEVAVVRFKKIVGKAGRAAADGLHRILVDIVSETAKKSIWG